MIKDARRVAWGLLWILVVFSSSMLPAMAQVASPDPVALLQEMSSYMRSLEAFELQANVAFDDVPLPNTKVLYSGSMQVQARRPDRLYVIYRDDLTARELWLDGSMVTVLAPTENLWAAAPAEPSIDATLSMLAADYDLSIPLDDLFVSDPQSTLLAKVEAERYLGLHQVNEVPCHHLIFGQETINWQVWIEAGSKPLVRKVVITYKTLPMAPQFTVVITGWNLNPTLPDSRFEPEIPEGAGRVEILAAEETQP